MFKMSEVKSRLVIGVSGKYFRFPIYCYLLRLESKPSNQSASKATGTKIEAKFRTFWLLKI